MSIFEAKHLINGRWVSGRVTSERRDPYRGTVVSSAPVGDAAAIDTALTAATAAAPEFGRTPGFERAALLRRVGELLEQRADDIGLMMTRETGKAISDSIAEVRRSHDTISLSAEEAVRIEGEHVPLEGSAMGAGKIAYLLPFPVGVVAAITPFNAPFNLACHKIGPAIAAGNAVVWKPAPQTPGLAQMLAQLFVDAGVPDGVLNMVHGGLEAGRALVSDARSSFVTFTGSSPAGEHIKAASGLRRVALELGGNGQTIVHEDADLSVAAPMCARNAMRLAGQSCISVQTVVVHRSVMNEFVALLVETVGTLKCGDPADPTTDVGTLIDEDAAVRVESWLGEAVSAGAKILTGGERKGAQIEPTVVVGVEPAMKLVCGEVFGPVVSVLPYDDLDEAIAQVNSSQYGLQTGIFTASNKVTMRAIREIRSGGVVINGTSTWRTDQLAYGGVRDSGIGREGPKYAIREMTDQRLVIFNM